MVREWGMSERLGHIAWGTQGPVFLGEELIHTRDYSDQTAHIIDEETTRILDDHANRATAELTSHRPQRDQLANALLDHETLESADIERIMATTVAAASNHERDGAGDHVLDAMVPPIRPPSRWTASRGDSPIPSQPR
jgi:cell division protease FtsH